MNKLLLTTTLLAAIGATPAQATLQLSISANGSTFTCSDGEVSCDQSGGANNLLVVDTSVGGAFIQITLAQDTFGPNSLQLSSANIENLSSAPIDIGLSAKDTGFTAPVKAINESASLTFNDAVGSGASTLNFFANGGSLFTTTGTPLTNPASFDGTHTSPFVSLSPFSMEETASLGLIAGGSITGFQESMNSAGAIPEPSTWTMFIAGFAFLGWAGWRRGSWARARKLSA